MSMALWLAVYCVGNNLTVVIAAVLRLVNVYSSSKVLNKVGKNFVNTIEFATLRVGWTIHYAWTTYLFFLNIHQALSKLGIFDA